MSLLAIAGGAGPGGEEILSCCGMFVFLPLVMLMAVYGVVRNTFWPALAALLLAAPPYLFMRVVVAAYQPSNDGDVRADQDTGRSAAELYGWLVGVAGLSVAWITARRLVGRSRKSGEAIGSDGARLRAHPDLPSAVSSA